MVARIGWLSLGAVVLCAVGMTVLVVLLIAPAEREHPYPRDGGPLLPPDRPDPWLLRDVPPEDEGLDPGRNPDPEMPSPGWTIRSLGLLTAVCLLLSIVGGALVGVALGSRLI